MLTDIQFEQWADEQGLDESSRAVIQRIRHSDPSRNVEGRRSNVKGTYPSKKMAMTIQYESHTVELPRIREHEHDRGVLEYYDQPEPFKVNYELPNGRKTGHMHTPDYFVIRADGAGWEECKPESQLVILSQKYSKRYSKDSDGKWHCPPAEEHAAKFGLSYRVFSDAEIDRIQQQNFEFLDDYRRDEQATVEAEAEREAVSLVTSHEGITLRAMLDDCSVATADDIYLLISRGVLYVDLRCAPIADPSRVTVYSGHDAVRRAAIAAADVGLGSLNALEIVPHAAVSFDGRPCEIVNLGDTQITYADEFGGLHDVLRDEFMRYAREGRLRAVGAAGSSRTSAAAKERLDQATEDEWKTAVEHYEAIRGCLDGIRKPASRSERRWVAAFKQWEVAEGCGIAGLLPDYRLRGNRKPQLPQSTHELMAAACEDYEQLTAPSKHSVYRALQKRCEEQGTDVPSYNTFCKVLNRRSRTQQVLRRRGRRAYNAAKPHLQSTELRHGDRPWYVAHIDHTELDAEVVINGINLGRPWLTLMVDAYSRRVLAFVLTFDAPSSRSCLMVIRVCVQRWGRLPQVIVTDNGKEFSSTVFRSSLARYSITHKYRPPAEPRFGSPVERLFKTTNDEFVHNLMGNTKLTREPRVVTKSTDPKGLAVWDLEGLNELMKEWLYKVYDETPHTTLSDTPKAVFERGVAESGARPFRVIAYDRDFEIATLPSTPKGTAKVVPGRGIKVHHIYYQSPEFLHPDVEGASVPVRFDPWDISYIYAYVRNHWVRCEGEHQFRLAGRSQVELQYASEVLRRQKSVGVKLRLGAKIIADFLDKLTSQQNDLALLRAAENKKVTPESPSGPASERPQAPPATKSPFADIDPNVLPTLGGDD